MCIEEMIQFQSKAINFLRPTLSLTEQNITNINQYLKPLLEDGLKVSFIYNLNKHQVLSLN